MMKILISAVAVALIVPHVAMAAWWNPFTWRIFSRPAEVRIEQAHDVSVESKKATTTVISTAEISQKKETTLNKNKKPVISAPKNQAESNLKKEQLLEITLKQEQNFAMSQTPRGNALEYAGTQITEAFIKNQTQDSFRKFCNVAKTISGHGGTKQVFNEDRSALVSQEITLYEEITSCALFLKEDSDGRGRNYQWTTNPSDLLLTLSISDSDATRKLKLEYNNRINALPSGTLVGYFNYSEMNMFPNQVLSKKEDEIALLEEGNKDGYLTSYGITLQQISLSTIVPSEEISRRAIFLRR